MLITVTETQFRGQTHSSAITKLYGVNYINKVLEVGGETNVYITANSKLEERVVSETLSAVETLITTTSASGQSIKVTSEGIVYLIPLANVVEVYPDPDNATDSIVRFIEEGGLGVKTLEVTEDVATVLSTVVVGATTSDTLAQVLGTGNTTGANDISIDSGQSIIFNNSSFTATLSEPTLAGNIVLTLPASTGTLALLSDVQAADELSEVLANGNTTGANDIIVSNGQAIQTAQLAGNTALLQAYDVDGTAYVTFITLTANNTPTMDLNATTTVGGSETIVTASSTDTFTNKTFDANGTGNSLSNVDVADLANGTDGELITWDAAGAPATVAVGTLGQVLTSNGAGAAPTFQDLPVDALSAVLGAGNTTGANDVTWSKTGTASGTASQVGSQAIELEMSLWTGAAESVEIWTIEAVASTLVDQQSSVQIKNNAGVTLISFESTGATFINDSGAPSPNNESLSVAGGAYIDAGSAATIGSNIGGVAIASGAGIGGLLATTQAFRIHNQGTAWTTFAEISDSSSSYTAAITGLAITIDNANTSSNTALTLSADNGVGDIALNVLVGEAKFAGDINHDGSNIGVFSATPAGQVADIVALTDSTGGTANNTVVAVPVVNGSGATTAQENAINDNFADLTAKINGLRDFARAHGYMA